VKWNGVNFNESKVAQTRSYKENFGVNLLYAKILALLLVLKSHVTT